MRLLSLVIAGAVLLAGSRTEAQGGPVNPVCTDPAYVGPAMDAGNACQRAFDSFGYASQQYGVLLSAGNMELGRADALGAFPNFRVAFRATGMVVFAPGFQTSNIPIGPAQPGPIFTQSYDFALVEIDGMLGLFKGFPVGSTHMGAVDAWTSFNVVPGASAAGYSISPQNKFYFAFGGRVGILAEGRAIPGVAVSFFQRNMPKSSVVASDQVGSGIAVNEFKMNTRAWSMTVGKHFDVVGLLVGAGQTHFASSATVGWTIQDTAGTAHPPVSASSTQTQYFGDFSLTLGQVDFVLEVGQVLGSTLKTYNTFDPHSDWGRSFASAAITFGHY